MRVLDDALAGLTIASVAVQIMRPVMREIGEYQQSRFDEERRFSRNRCTSVGQSGAFRLRDIRRAMSQENLEIFPAASRASARSMNHSERNAFRWRSVTTCHQGSGTLSPTPPNSLVAIDRIDPWAGTFSPDAFRPLS